MELVDDVGEEAASGGEHAIGHIGSKLFIGLGKVPGNFI